MKTYNVTNESELEAAMSSAVSGDQIIIESGIYYLDRIYSFNNLIVRGKSGLASDVKIRPQKGRGFVCDGGSTISDITFEGGGSVVECVGHGTTIRNVVCIDSNLPFKLSGDNHLVDSCALIRAGKTGIEINGGFYTHPDLGGKSVRLAKEIGIRGMTPSQDWTAAQIQLMTDLYYRRDMKCTVQNTIGFECGYAGGMMYGGFIKAVPCAGGITLKNNIGIQNLNDLWNDFASSTKFTISNNFLFGARRNSIFVEGYVGHDIGEKAEVEINGNLIYEAETGIFVSAFPNAKTWANVIYFSKYGKRAHGITGNRTMLDISATTPIDKPADILISLSPANYKGHTVAATQANYDFAGDELYHTEELVGLGDGSYYIEAPSNNYDPRTAIATEKWDIEFVVPDYVLNHPLMTAQIKRAMGLDVANTPNPTPDPDPTNSEAMAQLAKRVETLEGDMDTFTEIVSNVKTILS